jgi:AcrR family transcriptional regulator
MSTRFPRKKPRQARSTLTVGAILEAAIRVFETDGYQRATTIRIAAVAGVSVGSLYQYFPSKLALLAGVKQLTLEALFRQLAADLESAPKCLPGLRAAIRTNLKDAARHRQRWLMFAEHLPVRLDPTAQPPAEAPHVAMLAKYLRKHAAEIGGREPKIAALVIAEMVDAVTRSALRDRPEDLENGTLERELVDVVRLYLNL